jgi:hypothetical protein
MPRQELTPEQTSLLTVQEHKHLQYTYSLLFKSVILSPSNVLTLTTLEGAKFDLQVTAEGWKVITGGNPSDRQRTWEMVEDLLRSVSPAFKEGWDTLLLEKLAAVASTQTQNTKTTPTTP